MKLIDCPHCGTKNRLQGYSLKKIPSCGKCHTSLPEPTYIKITRTILKLKYWFILFTILGGAYLSTQWKERVTNETITAQVYEPQARHRYTPSKPTSNIPTFNKPVISVQQGINKIYTKRERVAPLEITTSKGAEIYYVKLEDVQTNNSVMTFFIFSGQRLEIEVPLGVYRLKYATGKNWYGEKYHFGPNTIYSKANETFEFYRQGDQVSGYSVELILQRKGNLRTEKIPASKF